MRIQMQSTPMKIDVSTQNAVVEMSQKPASVNMQIKHPKVKVESTLPKVEISQKQAFSESGLKSALEMTFDNANVARELLLQGMARASRQGDQLREIHKPDPIPDIARQNAVEQFKKDYNLGTMPKSGPEIHVIEGQLDIQVEEGSVEVEVEVNKPTINVTPGKVNVNVSQYNSLKMNVVGSEFDMRL